MADDDIDEKNYIDSVLNLHASDSLDSEDLSQPFMLTFRNEDNNIFKMIVDNGETQYIYQFKVRDYVNLKEKDFTSQINNFALLLATIEKAIDKNKVVLNEEKDAIKITFYYTNIYDEKKFLLNFIKNYPKKRKKKKRKKKKKEY